MTIEPLSDREKELIRAAIHELVRRPEMYKGFCTLLELVDLLDRLPIQSDETIRRFGG